MENFKQPDAKEVEKAFLDKEKITTAKPMSHEEALDSCAKMIYFYTPVLKDQLTKLSNKKLRRLILNLCTYPLTKAPYSPTEQQEKDVFLVADRIFLSKYSMVIATLVKKADETNNLNEEKTITEAELVSAPTELVSSNTSEMKEST
jgi:hypothetical protein